MKQLLATLVLCACVLGACHHKTDENTVPKSAQQSDNMNKQTAKQSRSSDY